MRHHVSTFTLVNVGWLGVTVPAFALIRLAIWGGLRQSRKAPDGLRISSPILCCPPFGGVENVVR